MARISRSREHRTGRGTRRGPQTRKHILDVSLRLFSERGFARTSIRDIARDVGITDAAIYYHFSSKQELLEALLEERGFTASIQQLEQGSAADLPLLECLQHMARGAITLMEENRDFVRLIVMEGLAGDETTAEQYRRLMDRWEAALTAVLERYQSRGELGGRDAAVVARSLIYVILAAFLDTLLGRHLPARGTSQARREQLLGFANAALTSLPLA
jgi:AcrR family transcriptional regulator|nr:nucleoid occlusion factor SlmA [uncultured bacterium]